jgi:uncharacterized membrane protein YhhN
MSFELGLGTGAWAALAAAAYWLVYCWRDEPGAVGAVVKTASTGLLALILVMAALGTLPALWPMALGLGLGAMGDWFLARRGERAFLAGMAAFGAGHLAYAGGMLSRGAELGFDGLSAGEWAVGFGLLGLVASTEVWLAPRTGAMRWPVRAYVAMIGVMGLVLIVLPDGNGADILRVGGALFILSDLLLALRLFVVTDTARQRVLSLTLWPVYWGGQALIGIGALVYWAAQA